MVYTHICHHRHHFSQNFNSHSIYLLSPVVPGPDNTRSPPLTQSHLTSLICSNSLSLSYPQCSHCYLCCHINTMCGQDLLIGTGSQIYFDF
jgi:hypothetical protein